ncbi:MAG: hypothetical protein AB7S26_37415 [Sandaracinaceae bacterium]
MEGPRRARPTERATTLATTLATILAKTLAMGIASALASAAGASVARAQEDMIFEEPPAVEAEPPPTPAPPVLPARVRLLVPTCSNSISWSALARALTVELAPLGVELTDEEGADLLVVLDLTCGAATETAHIALIHTASGRSREEPVQLTARLGAERSRELAVTLAELVRARYAELVLPREPAPPVPLATPAPPPVRVVSVQAVDPAAFDRQVQRAIAESTRDTEPAPAPPDAILLDATFGIYSYPAASNASSELRLGVSFGSAPFRFSVEAWTPFGWASDDLGEVALSGAGASIGLRYAQVERGFRFSTGLRLDGGWAHAIGIPARADVIAGELDALHLAALFDARIRIALGERTYFLVAPEIGAAMAGIEVTSDGHRVTAQLGPRIGVSLGFSFVP